MVYLTGLGLRLQATRGESEFNLRHNQNLNQQIFVEQSLTNQQDLGFQCEVGVHVLRGGVVTQMSKRLFF